MDRALKKIAFVCEQFTNGSPAQQLLDRFLIGFPQDGEFHRCTAEVHAWLAPGADESALAKRVADHSLRNHLTVEEAVAGAEGIVIVPRRLHSAELLRQSIAAAPNGACVFVYGAIAGDAASAKALAELATSKKVAVASGTSAAVTWRLPEVNVPAGAKVKQALIVVQGEKQLAALHGIDGLLALLERRANGERGVKSVRTVKGDGIWAEAVLPGKLLASAISRSDSPQGDPVRDGRTQDLVGLGLLPKLAKDPCAWVMEHTDGVRSAVAVLEGVVGDWNFAVELADGTVVSAQIYRPPTPQRHEFSRVAEIIEKFFVSTKAPWLPRRSILTAGLLKTFFDPGADAVTVRTPELEF